MDLFSAALSNIIPFSPKTSIGFSPSFYTNINNVFVKIIKNFEIETISIMHTTIEANHYIIFDSNR